jgi:hypothetical protein
MPVLGHDANNSHRVYLVRSFPTSGLIATLQAFENFLRRPLCVVVALRHIELERTDLLAHGRSPLIKGFRGRSILFNQR